MSNVAKMSPEEITKRDFAENHKVGFCKMPIGFSHKPALCASAACPTKPFFAPLRVESQWLCTKTEDQGSKPWCAAYAASQWAEAVQWKINGYLPDNIDPTWIYKDAKQLDGDPYSDGTTLFAVYEALLNKRTFDPEHCSVKVIRPDITDVKFALHKYGMILGGFNITDEWYELNAKKTAIYNQDADKGKRYGTCGGHAVMLVGYNEQGAYIQNSWGDGWGNAGMGLITWDEFKRQFMYGAVITNCFWNAD